MSHEKITGEKTEDRDFVATFSEQQVGEEIKKALHASRESEAAKEQATALLQELRDRIQQEVDSVATRDDMDRDSQISYVGELERHLTALDLVLGELA